MPEGLDRDTKKPITDPPCWSAESPHRQRSDSEHQTQRVERRLAPVDMGHKQALWHRRRADRPSWIFA